MNILIVDDHAMASKFYEACIADFFKDKQQLKIFNTGTCKDAYQAIVDKSKDERFTLAILDHQLPSHKEVQIYNGSDLGNLLRKHHPECKIIVITALTQALAIYDIVKKLQPDAFAIKSDIGSEDVLLIIEKVLNGEHFQSATVKRSTAKIYSEQIFVDDNNREIIFSLAKGYKIKDLSSIVRLPHSTIQKRILNMKSALGISSDQSLLLELNSRGFL